MLPAEDSDVSESDLDPEPDLVPEELPPGLDLDPEELSEPDFDPEALPPEPRDLLLPELPVLSEELPLGSVLSSDSIAAKDQDEIIQMSTKKGKHWIPTQNPPMTVRAPMSCGGWPGYGGGAPGGTPIISRAV